MRKATYIVGGIAAFLALLAAGLIVMFALGLAYGASDSWPLVAGFVLVSLVHLAGPVVGILMARRSRAGVGLAMVIVSLLVSVGLLALLPALVYATGQ